MRIRELRKERVWNIFKNNQLHTDDKNEFEDFWDRQDGIGSFGLMDNIKEIKKIKRLIG